MKNQMILISAITFSLAACGQDPENATNAGKAAMETAKVVVESGEKVVEQVKETAESVAMEAEQKTAGANGKDIYGPCAGCHGADGKQLALGVGAIIAGQSKDDIVMKINGYKDGSYGGQMKGSMTAMVNNLNDAQIAAVAEYISGL